MGGHSFEERGSRRARRQYAAMRGGASTAPAARATHSANSWGSVAPS